MKRGSMRVFAVCLTAAILSLGCGDESKSAARDTGVTPDMGVDSSVPPDTSTPNDTVISIDADVPDMTVAGPTGDWTLSLPQTEPTPGHDPEGAGAVDGALSGGEVRAGIVRTAADQAPFVGVDGRCRLGDFKIYNEAAAFCIEGPVSSNHILQGGGQLLDAVPLYREGIEDGLLITTPDMGLRSVNYTDIEVIRDGSDGEMAVIRARGLDAQIGLILALTQSDALAPPGEGFEVVTEYRLWPDSPVLEIVTWIEHPGDTLYRRRSTGDLLFLADTARFFFNGQGLGGTVPGTSDRIEAVAEGLSYGYYSEVEGPVFVINVGDTVIGPGLQNINGTFPGGYVGTYRRHFAVGDGSTFSVREAIEAHRGEVVERTAVELTLNEETTDAPIGGFIFQLLQGDDVVGAAQTDADGRARFNAPPGSYTVRFGMWNDIAIPDATLEVGSDPTQLGVIAPLAARLAVNVDAEANDGAALGASPAKIHINGPISRLVQSAGGREVVLLPEGDYTVRVSRGMEFTANTSSVQISAGETPSAQVDALLMHVLPTPGLAAGEFHQHAAPSLDSTVPVADRVLSNLVDGVDFMGPSDHDVSYDYNLTIAELGLTGQIFSLNGAEISPVWGHFGGIGIPSDPAKPSWGTLLLFTEDPETGKLAVRGPNEIVSDLKGVANAALVQLNHARTASQSILDYISYDPALGPEGFPEYPFLEQFDVIEMFNGRGATCVLLRDWYSFLNRGQRVIAVGNSDTHSLSSPAGFPRNYLGVVDDSPAAMNETVIVDAMRSGDVTIAGGALIRLGTGWRLGATHAETAGQAFDIPVQVSSPPWARVTTLITVVNGQVVDTQTFDPAESDIIDFDGVVSLTLDADAYVHFVAWGSQGMSAVYLGDRPYSMTNPLYVDVDGDADGDGEDYEPPGASATLPQVVDYDVCSF